MIQLWKVNLNSGMEYRLPFKNPKLWQGTELKNIEFDIFHFNNHFSLSGPF